MLAYNSHKLIFVVALMADMINSLSPEGLNAIGWQEFVAGLQTIEQLTGESGISTGTTTCCATGTC